MSIGQTGNSITGHSWGIVKIHLKIYIMLAGVVSHLQESVTLGNNGQNCVHSFPAECQVTRKLGNRPDRRLWVGYPLSNFEQPSDFE